MRYQDRIDALMDNSANTDHEQYTDWPVGWYQPIVFPDGSITRSGRVPDDEFHADTSKGVNKWKAVVEPYLPCRLKGALVVDIGCNAGCHVVSALKAGAEVVGIENHPLFNAQRRLVMEAFFGDGGRATFIHRNARDVDYAALAPIDLTLMLNALYWVVYWKKNELVPDWEKKMHKFLEDVSQASRWFLTVGCPGPRIGEALAVTLPYIEEHFKVHCAEEVPTPHRRFNVIVAEGAAGGYRD